MRNKKGFTLIELLVVIAIIGLLSTLAVVSLNNARGKARDARRISDVKAIQTAVELYKADQNDTMFTLPDAAAGAWTSIATDFLGVYLPAGMPTDPADNLYTICVDGTDYIVSTLLENTPPSAGVQTAAWAADATCIKSDDDAAVGVTCDATVNFCAGSSTIAI